MSAGAPVTADIHRAALGIIAARDARIAILERALIRLDEKRLHALAAARVNGDSIEDYRAALANIRKALGGDQ